MKKWKEYEEGFTLVEMIITIAVSAILAGAIVATMGYISSGNAKRSAARFNSQLNTAQTETMMKAAPTYLYLFKNNGLKVVLSQSETENLTSLQANANPVEVGGGRVKVTAKMPNNSSGDTKVLGDTDVIRIAFNKANGAYRYAKFDGETDDDLSFISELAFSGRENFKITLVKMTGKHILDK